MLGLTWPGLTHRIWVLHGQGSQTHNLGLTWQGLTNTQFGAHMAWAHKHTIWGSLGWGSHTIWSSLGQGSHTIWGSHGQGSHTQFGAHLAGPHTHTQFGAYISQSQSKFILVLFFQDSFIFQIYFENSGPQSTCYLEWTLTPFYCKWYGLEIEYILGM